MNPSSPSAPVQQDKYTELVSIQDINVKGIKAVLSNYFPEGFNYKLTPKQAADISRGLTRVIHGMRSRIPMLCRATECPYKLSCVLFKHGIAPLGGHCPIEQLFIDAHVEFYIKELDIDWDNSVVERGQIMRIIEYDIISMRASAWISINDWIWENVVGVNDQGQPIYRTEISPAFDVKERCQNMKSKILRELVATRAERAKIYDDKGSDKSIEVAERIKEARAILDANSTQQINEEIIDYD